MGADEDNRLTLQGLARRLETLERENAELRHKVATLEGSHTHRDELAALGGSDMRRAGEPPSEPEGQVSRRWLLSKAGAAALSTVAAGALLLRDTREAKADHHADGISVDYVHTHHIEAFHPLDGGWAVKGTTSGDLGEAAVEGVNGGSSPGVKGTSQGTGVEGFSDASGSTGVKGTGKYYGVWGQSSQAGIFSGVFGRNTNGTGVRGEGDDTGVVGKGKNSVYGESSTANYGAVVGRNNASAGIGTYGEGLNGIGVQGVGKNGVHGKSSEPGYGAVYGQHTANGSGVWGISTSGYGGQFWGGKAQLKLKPGDSAGAPGGAHAKGEVYMDRAATLWVCGRRQPGYVEEGHDDGGLRGRVLLPIAPPMSEPVRCGPISNRFRA